MRVPGGAFASAQDSESEVDGVRVEGTYYELPRAKRLEQPAPALDAKVLTGWNGLAIEALALAGSLLQHPEWITAAAEAADYLLEHHVGTRLARTSIDGQVSSASATLEDYGMLASALLQLAVSTGEARFAIAARELVDACLVDQAEPYFAVPGGADPVLSGMGLALETDPSEGAYPSGLSAIASASHRLWLLTANSRYRAAAYATMSSLSRLATERPISFGAALGVMTAVSADATQLVVVADGPSELADFARSWHRPGSIATVVTSEQARAFADAGFELYEGRVAQADSPTAYLCREFVCALPVHDVESLQLRR
jgi:uncharacterized protein YyaL (SSP411 family)